MAEPCNFSSGQTRPCGGIASSERPPRNPHVKLVLLGEQSVGKSSLALRFTRETFHEHNEPTIGAAFFMKSINLEEQSLTLDIWDTAGQERYHSLAPMYYRGAQAAIVVYDVTCMRSYERALAWIKELRRQADPDVLLFLVGNKADIATNNREVLTKDAHTYAAENGFMFAESSAKTGIGVPDIFLQIAELLAVKLASGETIWRKRADVQLDSTDRKRLFREQCCS